MANKTDMPEVITVHRVNNGENFPDNMHVTDLKPGVLLDDGIEECEYIRADLVQGDAKEPLEEGQWRWALHQCGRWDVGRVDTEHGIDELCLIIDGSAWYPEEMAKIGPVIRPPEDS